MCRNAHEIQMSWEPRGGDFYLHDYRGSTGTGVDFEKQAWGDKDETWNKVEILCYQPADAKQFWVSNQGKTSAVISAKDLVKEHSTWLPRQDQLQEMLKETWALDPWRLIAVFNDWNERQRVLPDDPETQTWHWKDAPLTTFEQLWFAFVMSEKYGKRWNGTDWYIK